ncbi:hypothetical protein FR943_13385 [Mycobacterium sp. TNTM28]|uniref:Uncharacterized protein n=1 Tax=[Mycobacterium] fortunisiensis TaxID=2600579 RepID=A0ABS6KML2_9MYCO|nr:hypothetical protein [[Mycobacterium] fortunisiensis]MBU9764829.1 hypothetical protein [[Mycobacterium] fortunisiensis]
MYLNTEQLAIANQAITETFEQTCIAWQAIPHWDTGDPGQSRVPSEVVNQPKFLRIRHRQVGFRVTLVQTHAPTPDSLIAEVNWAATKLARRVDNRVLRALRDNAAAKLPADAAYIPDLLGFLIDARAEVEDAGYRAPACLVTNTRALKYLADVTTGYPLTNELPSGAHVNSLHRASQFDEKFNVPSGSGVFDGTKGTVMVMLGRRRLIAHAGAPDASPGEEPVDLAVSVSPGLEVVGEAPNSRLALAVRIGFALRIKDNKALVTLYGKPIP